MYSLNTYETQVRSQGGDTSEYTHLVSNNPELDDGGSGYRLSPDGKGKRTGMGRPQIRNTEGRKCAIIGYEETNGAKA